MILGEFYVDIGVRQQPHIVEQRLAGMVPEPSFFTSRRAGVRMPSSRSVAVRTAGLPGLQKNVRQNRNGGLLFDHTLQQTQFADQSALLTVNSIERALSSSLYNGVDEYMIEPYSWGLSKSGRLPKLYKNLTVLAISACGGRAVKGCGKQA